MEAASLALSKVSLQAPINLSFTTFNRHKNTTSLQTSHTEIRVGAGQRFPKVDIFGALELQVGGFFLLTSCRSQFESFQSENTHLGFHLEEKIFGNAQNRRQYWEC